MILSLGQECPDTEFFVVRIQPEYRKIPTRKNSVFGQFLCNVYISKQ